MLHRLCWGCLLYVVPDKATDTIGGVTKLKMNVPLLANEPVDSMENPATTVEKMRVPGEKRK